MKVVIDACGRDDCELEECPNCVLMEEPDGPEVPQEALKMPRSEFWCAILVAIVAAFLVGLWLISIPW